MDDDEAEEEGLVVAADGCPPPPLLPLAAMVFITLHKYLLDFWVCFFAGVGLWAIFLTSWAKKIPTYRSPR
jgi:hypothetical protein